MKKEIYIIVQLLNDFVDYKKFYEKEGFRGWDFSIISKRMKVEGEKWDYVEVVKTCLNKKKVLLDIGTGGGEILLKLAPFAKEAFGIDYSKSMIKTANENLSKSKLSNVKFKVANAEKLPFEDKKFDIVICRHSNFFS